MSVGLQLHQVSRSFAIQPFEEHRVANKFIKSMIKWFKTFQSNQFQGDYQFHLAYEPKIITSSSTVSVTTYASKDLKATVPCTFKWRLIKNNVPIQVPEYKGCSFICEPHQVGSILQAEITSNDQQHAGTAIVTFGTINLDTTLRAAVSTALSKGSLNLGMALSDSINEEKQCEVRIEDKIITILRLNSEVNYSFEYFIGEPVITVKDYTKVNVDFNERYEEELKYFKRRVFNCGLDQSLSSIQASRVERRETQLQLTFKSRHDKEIFLLTVKAFLARREMKTAAVIRKIENINFGEQKMFDLAMEVAELKQDIVVYDKKYREVMNEKEELARGGLDRSNRPETRQMRSMLDETKSEPKPLVQFEAKASHLTRRMQALTSEIDHIRSAATKKPSQSQYNHRNLDQILEDLNRSEYYEEETLFKKVKDLEGNKLKLENQLNQAQKHIFILEQQKQRNIHSFKSPNRSPPHQKSIQPIYQHSPQTTHFVSAPRPVQFNNLGLPVISFARKIHASNLAPTVCSPQQDKSNRPDWSMELRASTETNSKHEIRLPDVEIAQTKEGFQRQRQGMINEHGNIQLKLKALSEQNRQIAAKLNHFEQLCHQKQKELENLRESSIKMQRKLKELQEERLFHKRNSDILNRSEVISQQMDSYNDDQNNLLRQQNALLVNENDKLSKACEKFMRDAKESHQLRKEVIELREKLRKATFETSSMLQ